MENVFKFIKSLNIKGYVILGCSGGPDSMALLYILKKLNIDVVCACVDHCIREESSIEYDYVNNYCNDNKIIFEGLKLDKADEKSESFYRKIRYDFYKNLANKYNTKYIMTAHHGDDLIETILMRLNRGSNLKGYIGFSKIYNENGYIFIKPLIYVTKNDILEYNSKNNIHYFIDKTNLENKHTRNRFRHIVLPFLKNEDENVHRKYLKFSEELESVNNFVNKYVNNAFNSNYNNNILDLDKFNDLDDLIKTKEIEKILSTIYKDDIYKIKSENVNNLLNNINKGVNFELSFPNNIVIRREYNKLIFNYIKEDISYNYILDKDVLLPNGDKICFISGSNNHSNYIIRLNSKDINLPLFVRTRKPSDKIFIKNFFHLKSIKSIFVNEKIPKINRDSYPIVVDSLDNVIWIPGIKKSKFDNEIDEKCDIILKYVRKEKLNEEKK